ncbi:MAG: hypothetical protein HC929_06675 [Leptolyngbyaceae cyanobacterium SM2_5_2]|nr:hypothetical protein [Leptolyngbyaceae cyanobacterium SM2_5_2]
MFVDAGSEDDTINVGSPAGLASTIAARLTVDGNDGVDALNLSDIGSLANSAGILTSTTITGLGLAVGVDYSRLENLTLNLGVGDNTFTLESTHTGQSTLNSGAGADTVAVHSIAGQTQVNTAAGNDQINVGNPEGQLSGIGAQLSVDGGPDFDRLYLNNTGDTLGTNLVLTPTGLTLTGMPGNLQYVNIEDFTIDLGDGDDTVTIESTHTAQTNLNLRGGNDTVYIHAISGLTNVDAGMGDDTITVGNPAQLVDNIRATLNLFGREGSDTLYVLDSGDTKDNIGTLNDTWMSGLGMGDRLNYTTLEILSISLGQAQDQFTINSVGTGLSTLNAGTGSDSIYANLQSLPEPGIFVLNGQGGNDLIDASTSLVGLVFNGDDGDDTVRGGSGHDLIGGGAGSDELVGNDGNDEIYGDSTFPNRATDAAYEGFTFPGDAMTAPPPHAPCP